MTTRLPFLLLTSRADDHLAQQERDGFLRITGLDASEVVHLRIEQGPFTPLDARAYAGVVLGGSPFTVTDPQESKSPDQRRVEDELTVFIRELVEQGVPYLGLCYGIGATSLALGGVVDRQFGEPVGTTTVCLNDAGRADRVTGSLPQEFTAFVGHKEACTEPPPGAVVLATSEACPVQAYRLGETGYVTQFHPELEIETFVNRIHAYAHLGYFRPEEKDALIEQAMTADVSAAHGMLRGFVREFAAS
ncbi:glutamine amidotransferase [Monashia sp. NPDC004114]